MNEELFRNKLMISSPTSISLGHVTWFALDTKLVGRVKALLEERDNLQFKIDKAIEIIDLITPELWNISNKMTYRLKDVKNILKEDK